MSVVGENVRLRAAGFPKSVAAIFAAPRFRIYLSFTALAVLASYFLGKEMMWDNLDYHLYAGFSAVHDRFSRDYFAAGVQAYTSSISNISPTVSLALAEAGMARNGRRAIGWTCIPTVDCLRRCRSNSSARSAARCRECVCRDAG